MIFQTMKIDINNRSWSEVVNLPFSLAATVLFRTNLAIYRKEQRDP